MRTQPLSPEAQMRVKAELVKANWYAIPELTDRVTRYRAQKEQLEDKERTAAAADPAAVPTEPPPLSQEQRAWYLAMKDPVERLDKAHARKAYFQRQPGGGHGW
jgi:hypothetical protein